MWNMILRVFIGGLFFLSALSFEHPAPVGWSAPVEPLPTDYFQMPVGVNTFRLSGTFGELRSNHFHTGIDVSPSSGKAGQAIYAAADGFIDRVAVQESGYGKALYIKHANGYTTVYAHLDWFSAEVERYVKSEQYQREEFEVNLYPKDGTFRVKKGEQIGNLGNTGSSEGAHLHFEIRRTAGQKPLNPLLFGLPVVDEVPPELRALKAYVLNPQREVLSSLNIPIEARGKGVYGVKGGDTLRLPAWRVGFGLRSFDQANGNPHNKNGLYSLTLLAEGQKNFQWLGDALDFDETRYLNAHTDYAAYQQNNGMFQRCFVLPGDRLSNYSRTESLGAIALYKEVPTRITLQAADAAGNVSTLNFWVLRGEPEPQPVFPNLLEMPIDVENRVDMKDFSMTLPKGALYETLHFEYGVDGPEPGMYSAVHQVHHKFTPLQRYCTLSIRPEQLPDALRSKAVIARPRKGAQPVNCGGSWENDFLVTRVRDFGEYCVMVDTAAPTIKPVVFSVDMRSKTTMSFRIQDDFRTDARANGLRYRATVDGKWILFEFDRKRARLTHHFDGRLAAGEHRLRLVVTDDRGNAGVYERDFIR